MIESTSSSASKSSCCGGAGAGAGAGSSSWLSGRGGLLLAATALGGAALWFGWPWLVVAGIAPLLIFLLPCLLMCGAMCAMKMCSKKKPDSTVADASPQVQAHDGMVGSAPAQLAQDPAQAPAAEARTPA